MSLGIVTRALGNIFKLSDETLSLLWSFQDFCRLSSFIIIKTNLIIVIWSMVYNILCLLCERLVASLLDKKYEVMFTGLPWLGMILVIADVCLLAYYF